MNVAPEPRDDASLPALWATARHAFAWLIAVFGGAKAVLALGMLTAKEHGEIACWLRGVEQLVRRLLLIEAAALGRPDAPPARARRSRERRKVAQDPASPHAWAVSFRACPRMGQDGVWAFRVRLPSIPDLMSPWPLAERIEAVSRVLADPAPFARRLAAQLARRPEKARRLAAPPTTRERGPADSALSAAAAQASTAAALFDSG